LLTPVVIDASAPDNPKMLAAGPDACWLWFRVLSWCRRFPSTQGRMPKARLASIAAGIWKPRQLAALAAKLVHERLWHDDGDAYRIHQFEQGEALIESLFAAIANERAAVQTPGPNGGSPVQLPPVQTGAVQSTQRTVLSASSPNAEPAEKAGASDRTATPAEEADAVRRARVADWTADRPAVDCLEDCPVDCNGACSPPSMRGVTARVSLRLRTEMAGVWDGVRGMSTSGTNRHRIMIAEPLLRRLATEQGLEPLELFKAGTARFKADESVRRKNFGLPVFLSQLAVWCAPPEKPPSGGDGPKGLAYQPVKVPDDFR
jgi:hypothetical protein